jgi:hypothetical protein
MREANARVNVVYRKFDGALHWHFSLGLLGNDEFGVWLAMPKGTVYRRGHHHERVGEHTSVLLIPRDQWWTACFNDPDDDTAVYCDIATVPTWRAGEVTMIDLDLDVVRRSDGIVYVDDEDEFAENQEKYAYPGDVIENATRTADDLLDAVAAEAGPFGGAHERWLHQVIE